MFQKIKTHHTIKRYFQEFADKQGLVYFGAVNHSDEIDLPKGITFNPSSKDTNYVSGSVGDYDLALFSRQAEHSNSTKQFANYSWTILSLELKQSGFPHVILDTRKHDKLFYDSVFTRFARLRRANAVVNQINKSASQYFDIYIAPESTITLLNLFDDATLERMITTFSNYSLELDSNKLSIFFRGEPYSTLPLTTLLNEALWLAETIELKSAYATNSEQALAETLVASN
jgi:hypothetical protein